MNLGVGAEEMLRKLIAYTILILAAMFLFTVRAEGDKPKEDREVRTIFLSCGQGLELRILGLAFDPGKVTYKVFNIDKEVIYLEPVIKGSVLVGTEKIKSDEVSRLTIGEAISCGNSTKRVGFLREEN
jgi:hypothetical protein